MSNQLRLSLFICSPLSLRMTHSDTIEIFFSFFTHYSLRFILFFSCANKTTMRREDLRLFFPFFFFLRIFLLFFHSPPIKSNFILQLWDRFSFIFFSYFKSVIIVVLGSNEENDERTWLIEPQIFELFAVICVLMQQLLQLENANNLINSCLSCNICIITSHVNCI